MIIIFLMLLMKLLFQFLFIFLILIPYKLNNKNIIVFFFFVFLQDLAQQIPIPTYSVLSKMQVQIFLVQVPQLQHSVNQTNQLDLVSALHLEQIYLDNLNSQLNKLLLLDKAVPLEILIYLVQHLVCLIIFNHIIHDKKNLFFYYFYFIQSIQVLVIQTLQPQV